VITQTKEEISTGNIYGKILLMRKNSSVNPFDPEYYQNQTWLHLTQALILVKLKVSYQ
jgi:hypothetical protein